MKRNLCNIFLIVVSIFLLLSTLFYSYQLNAKDKLLQYVQEKLASVTEKLELTIRKSDELAVQLDHTTKSLDKANETISALKSIEYELVYLGDFKLTHYCTEEFDHICGNGDGFTATGTKIIVGKTIAVDPSLIPYGSQVYIEGYGWYTADDCGGAVNGKHIDIAVETHEEALSKGVKNGGVWILVQKGLDNTK